MKYQVLARKHRPSTFQEVVGQQHVVQTLSNAIKSQRIAHAFLFDGPRGIGKTSIARILAKALNCVHGPTDTPCNECKHCIEITTGKSLDVLEIDGASNTGVDDIRELQRELLYANASARYKVYIIDEVHMLSKSAFNALLKTLEEPPENVVFIFATTEPHKIPPTIISRCQRYDFKRLSTIEIQQHLQDVCDKESIEASPEALYFIAKKADGGMRDSLSLLDQVIAFCGTEINAENVSKALGIIGQEVLFTMGKAIAEKDAGAILQAIHGAIEKGYELEEFLMAIIEHFRHLLVIKYDPDNETVPPHYLANFREQAQHFSIATLLAFIALLTKTRMELKISNHPLLLLEVTLLSFLELNRLGSISEQIQHVDELIPADSPVVEKKRQPQKTAPVEPVKVQEKTDHQSEPKPKIIPIQELIENWERYLAESPLDRSAQMLLKSITFKYQGNELLIQASTDLIYNAATEQATALEKWMNQLTGKSLKIQVMQLENKPQINVKKIRTVDVLHHVAPETADFLKKVGVENVQITQKLWDD